jgi:hypothetical protein
MRMRIEKASFIGSKFKNLLPPTTNCILFKLLNENLLSDRKREGHFSFKSLANFVKKEERSLIDGVRVMSLSYT